MQKLKKKDFYKTEILILGFLWVLSLATYSIALFSNYNLFLTDFLGLIGLSITTIVSYFNPKKSVFAVFVLLVLGSFNILSFAYFINLVLHFIIGIQLISLALLVVLVGKKFEVIAITFRENFGQNKEDLEKAKDSAKNLFKKRFEKLSDKEIDNKLQQELVPEAKSALLEIKEERVNTNLRIDKNSSTQIESPQLHLNGGGTQN